MTIRNKWLQHQIDLMLKLRAEGMEWRLVARRCGHAQSSCQNLMVTLRQQAGNPSVRADAWTPDEDAQLLGLHGTGTPWSDIYSRMAGRTRSACHTRLALLMRKIGGAQPKRRRQHAPDEPVPPTPKIPAGVPLRALKPAAPDCGYGRGTSTAKLLIDAELRARFELQGVTAGLLGDPLPGRSALDRKRAGIPDPPPSGSQLGRPRLCNGPKPTLAGT